MDCDDALSDVSTQDTRQKASQIVTGGGFGRGGGVGGARQERSRDQYDEEGGERRTQKWEGPAKTQEARLPV
jgi:hypothetical protein